MLYILNLSLILLKLLILFISFFNSIKMHIDLTFTLLFAGTDIILFSDLFIENKFWDKMFGILGGSLIGESLFLFIKEILRN